MESILFILWEKADNKLVFSGITIDFERNHSYYTHKVTNVELLFFGKIINGMTE